MKCGAKSSVEKIKAAVSYVFYNGNDETKWYKSGLKNVWIKWRYSSCDNTTRVIPVTYGGLYTNLWLKAH